MTNSICWSLLAIALVVSSLEFWFRNCHCRWVTANFAFTAASVHRHTERIASSEALNLAVVASLRGRSVLLLRLHGAFMLAAWIGAASIGILLARYFKQTWVGSSLCGKDQWFAVCRCDVDMEKCNALTMCVSISVASILYDRNLGIDNCRLCNYFCWNWRMVGWRQSSCNTGNNNYIFMFYSTVYGLI